MKKYILVLTMVFLLTLTACGDSNVDDEVSVLQTVKNELILPSEVTSETILPTNINGVTIEWNSSKGNTLTTDYVFIQVLEDVTITLVAILSYEEDVTVKEFSVVILNNFVDVVVDTYEPYYSGAETLTGEVLKDFLHELIDDHDELSYTQLWDALRYTDEDPNNKDNVILIYTGRSQSKEEIQSGNNYQDYWNREHVWPKYHGSFDTGDTEGTDLHHIRPSDVSVNGERGSLDFDYGGSVVNDGGVPTLNLKDGDSFEPRDEVKGDVARMIFYMAVRYEGENGELDLELNDLTYTQGTPFMGNLQILLEWSLNDPVDEFELHRNDVIEGYQGNRNPFIDHPEFAFYIWANN